MYNGVFIGKQSQYWTCPRPKFSKKHSKFSLLQCLDALLVKEAIFMSMYVYVYIYIYNFHMRKYVYANDDIVMILNATDAM